jgi:thimet oligopeptidase
LRPRQPANVPTQPIENPAPPDDRAAEPAAEVRAEPAAPTTPPDETFLLECRGFITQAKTQHQALIDITAKADVKVPRTIENTLEAFNEMTRLMRNASSMASLFSEVHPDAKVRDAARTCELEISKYSAELWLDKRVYDAVKAVDVSKADPTTKRFAALTLRDYKRAGVTLDDKKRARAQELEQKITEVGQEIGRTIAEDTRYIEITDKARLAGLPADYLAAHKPDDKGVVKISTDNPDYLPFVTYSTDDELKKQLYIKFRSRGDATNEAAIRSCSCARREGQAARSGLGRCRATTRCCAEASTRRSSSADHRAGRRARSRTTPSSAAAEAQDPARRSSTSGTAGPRMQSRKPSTPSTRRWCGTSRTTRCRRCSNHVEIYDVSTAVSASTWHPDVKVFDVTRKGDKLGRIFLDMHPRRKTSTRRSSRCATA